MVWSLVKPPAAAGPLSRIGDYLFAARGPGLFLRIRGRTTFPHKSAVPRGPPHPLFHRRRFSRIASCFAFALPLYLLANRSNRNSRIMRSILGPAEALADILMPYGMMSTWDSDLG